MSSCRQIFKTIFFRERIGHRFSDGVSALGSGVKGFLSSCSYKGTDCLSEEYEASKI